MAEVIDLADMPHAELIHQSLSGDLSENVRILKIILNAPLNEDVRFRDYAAGGLRICAVYMEGLADEDRIGDFVLRALKRPPENVQDGQTEKKPVIDLLNESLIEIAQTEKVSDNSDVIKKVLAGMTCLLAEDSEEALILETRNYPHRSVEKPSSEAVVSGSHEGFTEHLRTNITLVRRYMQSQELITTKVSVGTKVPTQLAVMYLNGVASEACVDEIKRRLMCIQAPTVNGSGALQQLLEDKPFALLPQLLQTERPDRVASCLSDGQVVILTENSPYALVAPVTLFHLIHASDDSFIRWQYGSFLRIIRMLGIFLSLTLPAFYIAVTLYHTHLIPMSLLTSIAESRTNVPLPIIIEMLIMEFSFYLLNEAGTRIPSQIGSALGIVGALILGQAAVAASIISPILIIIIALAGLGNYVIPNYGFGLGVILYRLFLLALSAMFGLYGLMIGLTLIVTRLCALKSFGIDYLSPISPEFRHNPDIILRLPVWLQKRILYFADSKSWMRTKKEERKA